MKKQATRMVILIFVFTFLGKIMGFLKSMIVASHFGANHLTDAYYLTDGITSDVFYAITMSLSVAFLPLYIKVKEENGKEAAKQFASRVLVNLSLISILVTLVLIFLSPIIIKMVAFSYVDSQFQLAVTFLRIMSVGIVFSLISDLMQNLLNAEEIYGYASLSSILNNGILILAVLLFNERIGILAIVIATPLSYLFQYMFLKLRSRKFVSYTFKYGLRDTNFKFLCKQAVPIFLSNATLELNQMIDQILLISIAEGAVTALSYSAVLFQFAAHILSLPISTVIYTEISQACAKKDFDTMRKLLQQVLKLFFLLGIPIAVIIFLASDVVVQIVYGRGEYDAIAITKTAVGLKYYAFCLIPYCIKQVFTKAFYSMEDTKTPMKLGIIEVLINIVSSIVLAHFLEIKGVVLGTALASTVMSMVLIVVFHKKYVSLNLRQVCGECFKLLIVTILIASIGFVLKNALVLPSIFLQFVVYTLIMFLIYFLLLLIFRDSTVFNILRKLGKHNKP